MPGPAGQRGIKVGSHGITRSYHQKSGVNILTKSTRNPPFFHRVRKVRVVCQDILDVR